MAQEYSPTEIFKRATAATLRAIAERDDVTVGFGPEPAGASGSRVRLPNPPRDLPAEEAAQLRGAADSVALRLRYHDDAVHSKRVPSGPLAKAVFDAVEQARVEALGSRRMAGVASNLEAMLGELDRAILDQDAYARAARKLLQDLDIDFGEADESEDTEEQQGGEESESE